MSQNHIQVAGKNGPINLIMGFDRPLRQIFCNPTPVNDDDPTDFSTLLFRGFSGIDELAKALTEVGLSVPESVLKAVEQDQQAEVGNVIRRFDAAGVQLVD
jgi:hypothetical protein